MTTNPVAFNFEYEGGNYQCFYALEDKNIRVSTPWGPKAADLGGGPPLTIAQLLAGELARSARVIE
jgi:hypothetical protein